MVLNSDLPTGIREYQSLVHIPNTISCKNGPDAPPTGHVYGMDGHCYRKWFIQAGEGQAPDWWGLPYGQLSRGSGETKWLIPQAGGRKCCLGKIPAHGRGKLPCNTSLRLVRSPDTDPVTICTPKPPNLIPTPRPSSREGKEPACAEWTCGENLRGTGRSGGMQVK